MTSADRSRIALAIAGAESGTTGRIAVRVIPGASVDAFARAREEFERAGLHRRDAGNAALLLIAPKARRFAVIGDRELHARVGDAFWNSVVEEMRPYFARDAMTDGILHGVGRVGEALQSHFAIPEASP